jgi:two-component SAPR family response regulator
LSKLYHSMGKTGEKHAALREAISVSREKGYDYPLSKELQYQTWMIQSIREHDIEQAYVRTLIKKSTLDMHWIEGRLFGVPRVYVDDKLVDDDDWQTTKTKKLFFYLLLHRDEKVSSDCLIDKLWHETSSKKGSDSLRKALQYIRTVTRSTLGIDAELVASAKGFYQLAPGVSVNLDVDEFNAFLKRMQECESDPERMELLRKAIGLCSKDFASGWYDDWTEELRRYYRRKHEECLVMLADLCYRAGKYSEAVEAGKDLVSLNPLEEKYHCRLMEALAPLGRFKEISEHYEKLRKDLRRELQTAPKKETLEVYEALVRAGSVH